MTAITDGLIRPLHHKPLTSLDRAKLRVMPAHALNGRFRGIADIGGFWSAMVRSRMTLSGHSCGAMPCSVLLTCHPPPVRLE